MLCVVSCSSEVIVDNPSLELSSSTFNSGEEVILTFNPGEDTNVDFNLVEFFWSNEKIGEVKGKPYQLKLLSAKRTSVSYNAVSGYR